jgi:Protein of unknown function (DUF3592)
MSGNIGTALLVLLFAVATAVLAWQRLKADKLNAKLSGESANWPTAPGEITSAKIDVQRTTRHNDATNTDDESSRYQPKVEYLYTVGDQQYRGSRINFNLLDFAFENPARKVIEKYAVGARLPVAYDPADPNISVLDRDTKPRAVNLSTIVFFVLAVVIGVLGVVLLFVPFSPGSDD